MADVAMATDSQLTDSQVRQQQLDAELDADLEDPDDDDLGGTPPVDGDDPEFEEEEEEEEEEEPAGHLSGLVDVPAGAGAEAEEEEDDELSFEQVLSVMKRTTKELVENKEALNEANAKFRKFMTTVSTADAELHSAMLKVWELRLTAQGLLKKYADIPLDDAIAAMANAMFLPLQRKNLLDKLTTLKTKKQELVDAEVERKLEEQRKKTRDSLMRKFDTSSGDRKPQKRRRRS